MTPYRIEYNPKTKTCVVHNHNVNVLKYVGSDDFIESEEEFKKLKQDIKFESKVLE